MLKILEYYFTEVSQVNNFNAFYLFYDAFLDGLCDAWISYRVFFHVFSFVSF